MKKFRKYMMLALLLAILVYPLKKHSDIVMDLVNSVFHVIKEPFATIKKIEDSKELSGFPQGCAEIISSFKEKLPNEKEFFVSDAINVDALSSQRMIEYNFPLLSNKNAKCGYIFTSDVVNDQAIKVIDVKGVYQLVCHP